MTCIIDLRGHTYGRLTVTGYIGQAKRLTWWNVRCECGRETIADTASLRRKVRPTRSCGCLTVEATKRRFSALRGPAMAIGKECRACGAVKPASAFYERADTFDGMHHMCKTCFIDDVNSRRQRQRVAA